MPFDCWNRSFAYSKSLKDYQRNIGGMDSSIPYPGFPSKEYLTTVKLMREKSNEEREYLERSCPNIFKFTQFIMNR